MLGRVKMLRIGLYLPVFGGWFRIDEKEKAPSYGYMKEIAEEAERIGIDSLWIPDHLLNPMKGDRAPTLEAWTLAAAIAEATENVIISHAVLCEAFRFPAVLAKQAATLNEISEGRFWLSLGAGFYQREYEAYGLPFLFHDERVLRTKEAISIIKKLWTEENVTFRGHYHSILNSTLSPKPNPMPRICYGGNSEPSLELISEDVDCWLMHRCKIEEAETNVIEMEKRVKTKKREERLEIAIPVFSFIRNTDEEAIDYVNRLTSGSERERRLILNSSFVGSPQKIAQSARRLESIGINHVLFQMSPTLTELSKLSTVLSVLREEDMIS